MLSQSDTSDTSNNDNVTTLDEIVINLYSCEKFITGLLHARENILKQSNNGKNGYYTFSYPGVGWVQYDHNSIQEIYKLSELKSKKELFMLYKNNKLKSRLRLHSVAAIIIKCVDHFNNLYDGIVKSKNLTKDNRLVYITVSNPFHGIIKTDINTKKYTGNEIIELHNIGMSRRFRSLFPS